MSSRLNELVLATPATRDRYVDFLRAASIVAVVIGHWFISINHLLALWPLGVGHQHDTTAAWWLLRPVFIGLSALVLGGIVALVGRFERHVRRSSAA